MIFGNDKKRIEELEAENANLKQWVEYFKGFDAMQLAQQTASLQNQVANLSQQIAVAKTELEAVRQNIVVTEESLILQEIGIYRFRHPLDDAVAYQAQLKKTKDAIASIAKQGAVSSANRWTVNNSTAEGEKMTRDISKLMLRAYNSEADSLVRFLKPHSLDSAIARLNKARETIAKLGKIIQLEIIEVYHKWRIYELELTADYLAKVEEEKEQLREERARRRDEEKAIREMEAEKRRLEKEQSHYITALQKVRENGDLNAVAEIEAKLKQIDSAIVGIENREANIRAGYVYVISNFGSFGEHMVKIGMTRRLDPLDRVRELSDASVPFNFDVHALVFSDDAVGLENKLHTFFSDKRVNLVNFRREFFYVTPVQVRQALMEIGKQHLLEFHLVPDATEWRASGGPQRAALTNDQAPIRPFDQ